MLACQTAITMTDTSHIGEARRLSTRIAENAGLNETNCGRAAIIATELATNLVRYAPGGELLLRSVTGQDRKSVEIMSVDRGPGIAELGRSLEDGVSSGGTAGEGLGAVRRLSSEFDIYSSQPGGTVVFSRLHDQPDAKWALQPFLWAVVSRPAPHETRCGDHWCVAERAGGFAIMLADGLGHGPLAADAAEAAAAVFNRDPYAAPMAILQAADAGMRGTRGGAMAVACIDARERTLKYAGVGNIAGHLRCWGVETGRGLVSHNGTVGVEMRKVQQFDYECPPKGLLVMHSDGLQSRWSLQGYPGLAQRHPGLIAGVLYRDFTRGRDDVTVAVVRLCFADG